MWLGMIAAAVIAGTLVSIPLWVIASEILRIRQALRQGRGFSDRS